MENSNQVFVVYFENELYGIYSNIDDAIIVTEKVHKSYIDTSHSIDSGKLCIDTKMYYVIILSDNCWEIVLSCKHRNEPEFVMEEGTSDFMFESGNYPIYKFGVIAENTEDALELASIRHEIFTSKDLYVKNEYISPITFKIINK